MLFSRVPPPPMFRSEHRGTLLSDECGLTSMSGCFDKRLYSMSVSRGCAHRSMETQMSMSLAGDDILEILRCIEHPDPNSFPRRNSCHINPTSGLLFLLLLSPNHFHPPTRLCIPPHELRQKPSSSSATPTVRTPYVLVVIPFVLVLIPFVPVALTRRNSSNNNKSPFRLVGLKCCEQKEHYREYRSFPASLSLSLSPPPPPPPPPTQLSSLPAFSLTLCPSRITEP